MEPPFFFPWRTQRCAGRWNSWFDSLQIKPKVCGEFADTVLLKVFGQNGAGVFAARSILERDSQRLYQARLIGRVESIRERCYAISVEKKLKHPAVVAITEAARANLFA